MRVSKIFCGLKSNDYMNLIDLKLAEIKKRNCIGLMTHVVVGYPSFRATSKLVQVMAAAGADFIELQIPFSDPLADGPTIMMACEKSLERGTRVRDAFTIAAVLSRKVSAPLLFMAYYNTVFRYGVRKFCRDAARAGVSGLIVPDVPLEEEEGEKFSASAKANNLYAIRVVAPVSTPVRLKKNAAVAEGFVYCSARQGITGAKKEFSSDLISYLKKVRKVFKIPLAVGFGVSNREHIEKLAPHADIAVVGSAIIDVVKVSPRPLLIRNVERFVRALKRNSN
ncbi:MAG: Tryptophan synthase alpha chain [Candidatus Magasanikbacteria bacterium GW2011_GWA2_46_17]|uniref:Tryptophan synthase alpha chain n=1 Tax=Candidatus Magasanikbacteria bacterium GW2011_GWA2_46_17 TaxID=1619042 RepID=A0A0G1NZS7_9BACT|nr:MAG: Tryptophan synthase alpha chain [Candidatus Magasanikbacteria bacterium GW2011_GWA2_46_17]